MDEMRYKTMPFEIKAVDEDEGTFEGYAAAFGNVDSYGDVIEKGAFKKTIKENFARIKVAWQHMWWEPIGRPLELREDDHGLWQKSKVSLTQQGRDALTLMRDGVVTELSIGYRVVKAAFDKEAEVYRIKELQLWEFSPVTWAANDLAVITGVKAAQLARAIGSLAHGQADPAAVKAAIEALTALLPAEPGLPTLSDGAASVKDDEPVLDHSALSVIAQAIAQKNELTREIISGCHR